MPSGNIAALPTSCSSPMRNSRKRAAAKEWPPQQQETTGKNENSKEAAGTAAFGAICGDQNGGGGDGQMAKGGEGGGGREMPATREEKAPLLLEDKNGIAGGTTEGMTFGLSWQIEWSGTFPIGKISAENVAKRLDSLLGSAPNGIQQPKRRLAGTRAVLTITPQGVTASAVDNAKLIFLSHPIRKVCCVVGRVETRQLAYITREQPSHSGHDIPYRKQCHIFRTQTSFEVEEIESVLSAAFQRALSRDGTLPMQMLNSPSPKLRLASATVRDVATSPLLDINPSPMKTPKKDKGGFLERSRSQMRISSSSLIQKIFGTPKKQQQTYQNHQHHLASSPPEKAALPILMPSQNNHTGNGGVRFRKPRWPLTPLRSTTSTSSTTPKRPTSTALANGRHPPPSSSSSPCHHQYQSTTMIDAKRNSCSSSSNNHPTMPPLGTPQRFSSNSSNHTNKQNAVANDGFLAPLCPMEQKSCSRRGNSPAELVYDERLKEWIYTMDDECMLAELERLAYYCRPNEKDYVMDQLRRMPMGHFVLRLSGSRRRCLALSVRVDEGESNPKGIAHYLILRNEHGFRIRGSKRYFQSLPMLITHHSVLAEQLPCRLQLSDWRWTREPQMTRRRQSSGGSTLAALRAHDECEATMVRWRKPPLGINGGIGRNHDDHQKWHQPRTTTTTSSTLFSSKSSTLLSA